MHPTYRLYIDESGDHTYGRAEEQPFILRHKGEVILNTIIDSYPQLEQNEKRYLGLTGCIFKLDYYRDGFVPTMEAFKRNFFDPDEHVILHAKDIIQRRSHFHILQNQDVSERFDAGMINLMSNAEYTIINVVIDKKNHIERYGKAAWHPYHYCLANMLARYCYFLKRRRARGDVLAESRGKTEDFELRAAYSSLFNRGTHFLSGTFFRQYLTSKEIKIKPKQKNIAGLQLADLLTHPLKKYTLMRQGLLDADEGLFWHKVVDAAKTKLDRRDDDGATDGYGVVFIK